jgi:hypothetical protein
MNPASAAEPNPLTRDAIALRDAYLRASGLSRDQRRAVLGTVLRYRLRNLAPEAARESLRKMREAFAGEAGPGRTAATSPARTAPAYAPAVESDDLRELLRLIAGSGAGDAGAESVRAIAERLRTEMQVLRAVLRKPNFSLEELLRRAARDLSAHDSALEHAARESFDRVLSALDPAEVMKAVAKKTLSTEAMYKAALFDALKEKHDNLQMYHGKGRLVRDYKSAYKKYVQEETSR